MFKKILIGIGGLLLALMVLMGAVSWWAVSGDAAPPQPAFAQSPEQARAQQIQAAVDRGEAQLIANLKAQMHDPASFELVSDRAIDAGDHITMVMVYRGRNGFNALRREAVGATFDLQGGITSVRKVE